MELTKIMKLVTERLQNHTDDLEKKAEEILKELNLLHYIENCGYSTYETVPLHKHLPDAPALQKKLYEFNRQFDGNLDFKYNENNYKISIVCGKIYFILNHYLLHNSKPVS